ncbi:MULTISPECIES: DEAD/DEAH box helicase [unclassified Planococcus (in: firmicutes)]|uniref:DEAD/DEAH box helicase n=2 Tax=Caryophanaceae TaxID=186818 RepID=UPI000C7BC678|nr:MULTISPECIES: DEAD/DEAH box helicase [unclassified Planococcus (in: firmicutes)]PKG44888.1 ATP-dependent helicase [Planococcus sp. Urea-trap-24]PKG87231.1 ATP-dependent helicase [Planococcus sp. Urea-3u-39]PKH42356.1 ATP-dependent helicase [Planococcus sp. MB-3u-09]
MNQFQTEGSRTYYLKIDQSDVFRLQAYNDSGNRIPPEIWSPFLFFADKDSFFGMNVQTDGLDLLLTPADFVRLFQQDPHHYVQFSGRRLQDEAWLKLARRVADSLNDSALWQHVQVEDGVISIDAAYGDAEIRSFLTDTIQHQLRQKGLTSAQLPYLLHFVEHAGWDGLEPADDYVLAMQLTEPDDSGLWAFRTALRTKRGSAYWTPSKRRENEVIEKVLPEKWRAHAREIQERQSLILSLCPSVDRYEADQMYIARWTDAEVLNFLRNDADLLQAFGVEVSIPSWLQAVQESKVRVKANVTSPAKKASVVGLDQIISFDWKFSLNGHDLSMQDFEQLVTENREFIRVGNEWVRVDSNLLMQLRQMIEEAEDADWTLKDMLFHNVPDVMLEEPGEEDDPLVEFHLNKSLKVLLDKLLDKRDLPETPLPENLKTELRPYQKTGFDYLTFMREEGFGLCLADDMGLGKTVQLIAYLLHVHSEKPKQPSLIICPTSVLGNWQKELERFAPDLKVATHYGSNRPKGQAFLDSLAAEQPDVVLSTYGIASSDSVEIQSITWTSITLDEAQNIKNMYTKQSRTIRKFKGQHHIALTGTPIENRLSELWSIFDFINKGYLYRIKQFQEAFMVPIERDDSEQAKEKLRQRIQPFLLRRTKKDPELQLNLPEKLEQLEYCPLTPEQAALYEGLVQDTVQKMGTLTGFEKKGLVLKMLSKLKQLCNHPSLYLKEPYTTADELLPRSQKLERIVTLAGEIAERGEQCLIFTQYIGMGHLLQQALNELYGHEVPFLTGHMPKNQRDSLVAAFQNGEFPIFILSLKAGGTGLNLTAATHVLHADRWWNPAVENQATDRAYRIGQTQFVHVHKFVTIGTIEEKIDSLLTQKQSMSDQFIQSSQWMTELSDDELKELFTYSF